MGRIGQIINAVGYWVDAQIRPFNKIVAGELKFVGDVEGHCEMCLLVEEDKEERLLLSSMLGRVTEIQALAKEYCRLVRRAMAARIGAVTTGKWTEFEDRVIAEAKVLEELCDKIAQLRTLCSEISVQHIGRDTKAEQATIPRG